MAITRTETQVTWPTAADYKDVTTGGNETSEEINLDATCISARISLKADNQSTPASDDIIYVWLLETSGDPDGASTDEFDTIGHATLLAILNTDTEDPAGETVQFPVPQKGAKLYAEGVTAGTTNTIRVSATITEQRAA